MDQINWNLEYWQNNIFATSNFSKRWLSCIMNNNEKDFEIDFNNGQVKILTFFTDCNWNGYLHYFELVELG